MSSSSAHAYQTQAGIHFFLKKRTNKAPYKPNTEYRQSNYKKMKSSVRQTCFQEGFARSARIVLPLLIKISTRSTLRYCQSKLIPWKLVHDQPDCMDSGLKSCKSAITENIASAVIFLIFILFAFSALLLLSFFFVSIFVYSFLLYIKSAAATYIKFTMRPCNLMDVWYFCLI